MVTQQLLDYIKQQMQMGKNKEQITQELLNGGWQAQVVEQAFISLNPETASAAIPTMTEMPKAAQIYKEAWTIYKSRFKTLVVINLIPILGFFLFGILAGIIGLSNNKFKANFEGPTLIILLIIALIILVALIYVSLWATVAELTAIKDQAEGINIHEAFKRSKNKIWAFFGVSFITGLAIMGGFILFIIPGILFAFWFGQAIYVYIEEGIEGTAALKKSKYYVKGRIGQIFGKGFYITIITVGLYICFGIILGIISVALHLKQEYVSGLSNIFSLIWSPMATVYAYLVYKYLKATRP